MRQKTAPFNSMRGVNISSSSEDAVSWSSTTASNYKRFHLLFRTCVILSFPHRNLKCCLSCHLFLDIM